VEVSPEGDDIRVVMTQAGIENSEPCSTADRKAVHSARAGHWPADLDNSLRYRSVSTGHSKVLVPLSSRSRLDSNQDQTMPCFRD